jgi:triacylglycerol esterase/lipase EstA (alpha/beta hydrolase family)
MSLSLASILPSRAILKCPCWILRFFGIVAITGCLSTTLPPEHGKQHAARNDLKEAQAKTLPAEQRAVLYLNAAQRAVSLLGSRSQGESARVLYNQAVADLTVLLRTADHGRLWNRALTLTGRDGIYQLRFAKPSRDGVWDPGYFTGMTQAGEIPDGDLDRRNLRAGIGGTLVGNYKPQPLPPHVRDCGINAAVTATLEFNGHEVLLTLLDPSVRKSTRVAGIERPLAADFSAPLAAYPQGSELWHGIMGALRVEQYMSRMGLFMVRPYDPNRIPVIFVHGLASTPRMWRRVINELEIDPEFRSRYQCWLFSYPTGNPPAYSALRLRQELASIERSYPHSRPYVLVGHSMGGLLARMQVTTLTRESWNAIGKDKAARFFTNVKPGDIIDQATHYQVNPRVARVIFICTPHRGSKMAVGRVGNLAAKLISLPTQLTGMVAHSVGDSIAMITGDPSRMPTSVTGLSPNNLTLKVLDRSPIQAPHHSIIGDRGKGDSPNSSDGVVDYWSSHLKSAKSERIVPGPHSACELPGTLAEIRRILHLHLRSN